MVRHFDNHAMCAKYFENLYLSGTFVSRTFYVDRLANCGVCLTLYILYPNLVADWFMPILFMEQFSHSLNAAFLMSFYADCLK